MYHSKPSKNDFVFQVILDSKIAKISGWGSLKQRGLYPDYLQEAEVEIYSDRRCKKSKLGYYYRPEIMMCASSYPMDSCSVKQRHLQKGRWLVVTFRNLLSG